MLLPFRLKSHWRHATSHFRMTTTIQLLLPNLVIRIRLSMFLFVRFQHLCQCDE